MSTEYRPASGIQFSPIDFRLEKHGIKAEVSDCTIALSGRNGASLPNLKAKALISNESWAWIRQTCLRQFKPMC